MRRGNFCGRFDVAYNQATQLVTVDSLYPRKSICDILKTIQSGGTPKKAVAEYWGSDINWISPKDFSDDIEISSSELKITKKGLDDSRLSLMKTGTVVIVVRSSILAHTLPVAVLSSPSTINQDIKALTFSNDIETKYIPYYLTIHQDYLLPLIRKHGSTVHSVNTPELLKLKIPIPPIDTQRHLVAELDATCVERDRALSEAKQLLTSIDEHVLKELAILPEADDRRIFAVRLDQVKPRLDADYHSPYFQRLRRAIEHSKHATQNLGDLALFMRSGFAAGRQNQAHGNEAAVPHLRPLNLNAWGELSITETKSVPASRVKGGDYLEKGEVLFNNTNSAEWVGKTAVFELETPCSCSNHMTRISLKPGIEPYFVAALLNAFRGIGYFSALSTFFNNQAGINSNTLAKLRVPVPDAKTQNTIAHEVVSRKNKARQLQTHAETIWREARERFEQQLLQGNKS